MLTPDAIMNRLQSVQINLLKFEGCLNISDIKMKEDVAIHLINELLVLRRNRDLSIQMHVDVQHRNNKSINCIIVQEYFQKRYNYEI